MHSEVNAKGLKLLTPELCLVHQIMTDLCGLGIIIESDD